jgi:hypothetical protein
MARRRRKRRALGALGSDSARRALNAAEAAVKEASRAIDGGRCAAAFGSLASARERIAVAKLEAGQGETTSVFRDRLALLADMTDTQWKRATTRCICKG